eukprot:m.38929 g.38929  ORF g.38929 m.38929 type:complete len:54 (+) comp9492_c0_seq1:1416-1577(+)
MSNNQSNIRRDADFVNEEEEVWVEQSSMITKTQTMRERDDKRKGENTRLSNSS